MNRPIKFRAWDKEKKEWFSGYGNIEYLLSQYPPSEECKYDYCQFTGLFDKNGKEIYEGDIVSIDGFNSQAVVFEKGQFLPRPHNEQFEIIGNIYENSDLLV